MHIQYLVQVYTDNTPAQSRQCWPTTVTLAHLRCDSTPPTSRQKVLQKVPLSIMCVAGCSQLYAYSTCIVMLFLVLHVGVCNLDMLRWNRRRLSEYRLRVIIISHYPLGCRSVSLRMRLLVDMNDLCLMVCRAYKRLWSLHQSQKQTEGLNTPRDKIIKHGMVSVHSAFPSPCDYWLIALLTCTLQVWAQRALYSRTLYSRTTCAYSM